MRRVGCGWTQVGSSPHTRGALPGLKAARETLTDHPRIRGEHAGEVRVVVAVEGSSPHTRGAPAPSGRGEGRGRIIPAYAGSTSRQETFPVRNLDHPRIRGEHGPMKPAPIRRRGSSSHTRGARRGRRAGAVRRGIIPAYAGSTLSVPLRMWNSSDHPRIRGEHEVQIPLFRILAGSSPHTRGARG